MYLLTKTDGTELGLTERVLYIKVNENGIFQGAERREAVGVAYCNKAYNLSGHSEIEGKETVTVRKVDGGIEVTRRNIDTELAVTEMDLKNIEAQQAITELELRILEAQNV